ncbi:10793_t:CDS:10 [Diversispora eburnea]|uniref:10793_t:CDS:1 n=1 Tax=Diversispora eburnea TaxID=1213867 RepID=A0A9N8Z779_9GLOM|nr:10793_t:CDS:10 [Diversispora eburnea]
MIVTALARLMLAEIAGLTDQSQVRAPLLPIPPLPPLSRIKAPPIMVERGQHTPTSKMGRGNDVTLEEYKRRSDKFNVQEIVKKCIPVDGTNAEIIGLGATRTRADNSGKEADASFRPMKLRVPAPTGSDGEEYSRAHDAIVVKIDPVSERMPSHMQAWHFCSRDRRIREGELPHRTHPKAKPSKKVAPAPYPVKKKDAGKTAKNPLFEKKPRNFGIGQDIQPKRDLSRFVKWPEYVRLQRQRKILNQRLKVPPAINQFTKALDKNTASNVFKLLNKYRPETKAEKKQRLLTAANLKAENKQYTPKKPYVVKYGINHITALVESKQAKLVLIAHDVDPIEIVLWLPALCRKMLVPYAIIKSKARLGTVVHKKTATALALVDIRDEDKSTFANLINGIKAGYNDKFDEVRKHWGGGVMGTKSQSMMAKREKTVGKEIK